MMVINLTELSALDQFLVWVLLAVAVIGIFYCLLLYLLVLGKESVANTQQSFQHRNKWFYVGCSAYFEVQPLFLFITVMFWLVTFSFFHVFVFSMMFMLLSVLAFSIFYGLEGIIGVPSRIMAEINKGTSDDGVFQIAYSSSAIMSLFTESVGLIAGIVLLALASFLQIDVYEALISYAFGAILVAVVYFVGGKVYTIGAENGKFLLYKRFSAELNEDTLFIRRFLKMSLLSRHITEATAQIADFFESHEVAMVSTIMVGISLYSFTGEWKWVILPLIVRGCGIISSIIRTSSVILRKNGTDTIEQRIFGHYVLSIGVLMVGLEIFSVVYMQDLRLFVVFLVGLSLVILFSFLGRKNAPSKKENRLDLNANNDSHTNHTNASLQKQKPATTKERLAEPTHFPFKVGLLNSGFQIAIVSGAIFLVTFIFQSTITLPLFPTLWSKIVVIGTKQLVYVFYGLALLGIFLLTVATDELFHDFFNSIVKTTSEFANNTKNNMKMHADGALTVLKRVMWETRRTFGNIGHTIIFFVGLSVFGALTVYLKKRATMMSVSGMELQILLVMLIAWMFLLILGDLSIQVLKKATQPFIRQIGAVFSRHRDETANAVSIVANVITHATLTTQKYILQLVVVEWILLLILSFVLTASDFLIFLLTLLMLALIVSLLPINNGNTVANYHESEQNLILLIHRTKELQVQQIKRVLIVTFVLLPFTRYLIAFEERFVFAFSKIVLKIVFISIGTLIIILWYFLSQRITKLMVKKFLQYVEH